MCNWFMCGGPTPCGGNRKRKTLLRPCVRLLGIPTWLIEALQLSLVLCEVGETQPRCPTKVPDKENEVVMVTGEWKGRK